jgi:hypothetical protein
MSPPGGGYSEDPLVPLMLGIILVITGVVIPLVDKIRR